MRFAELASMAVLAAMVVYVLAWLGWQIMGAL